ncbi:MAG: hypothetical protein LBF83_01120, partial [Spirochaetaceae bacterium]|nr:hypothetical protein [Spirochaetaceae bacterium]
SAKAETPITLTVSPAENYSLAGLTVSKNGGGTVDVSGSGPYTFTMPAADVTVTAGFRQSSDGDNGTLYSVTIGQLTNGSVSAGLYNATAETTVTLTVNPAEGCRLKANSLTVTKADSSPVSVSGSGPYTFTMPAENVEVSAEFEPIPFSGSSTAAGDSVIDLIKAAAGEASLTLTLAAANEEDVQLIVDKDLGTTGLILKHEEQETDTSPASVTIDGGGRVVDLTGSATGSPLITVGDGVTLTLKNITLKGLSNTDNDSNDNNAPLVKVVAGGALVLETGAVIEKNDVKTNSSIHGLGVHITGTGATFTMYDGSEVRNNIGYIWNGGAAGGGVYVDNGGTFNMEGGSVTGNTARRGAVAASGTGIVNLRGGSISGNTGKYGGGVSAGINGNYGGGIVNMYGGSVSGNTGNDIWIFTGEFRMYGGYSEHLTNENLFTIEGPITWNGAVSGNVTFSGNVAGSGTMNVTGTVYTKGYTYSGLVIEATGGINTTS